MRSALCRGGRLYLCSFVALSHFQDASDNDLFNKVITVFAVLCDEIQELRLTAENARPPKHTAHAV